MVKRKLVIFGAGKIAESVYYSAIDDDVDYEVVCFCVDDGYESINNINGVPVLKYKDVLNNYSIKDTHFFIAIGYQDINSIRENIYLRVKRHGYKIASLVHSSHKCYNNIYGENVFTMKGAVLHPCVTLGNNVFVWGGAVICHHSIINDNSWITAGSNIMGGAIVGKNSFVAGGALIGHAVTIGDYSIIGANTQITKSTEDKSVFLNRDTDKFRLDSERFIKITKSI